MRYLYSLAEQGFAALLNFGINLWLIRQVGATEYGVFVFWNNASLLLNSLQGAWTLCHLMALPPGPRHVPERRQPERILFELTILLLGFAAAVGLLAWGMGHAVKFDAPLILVGFLPAFLAYQYVRALAYSRGAVRQAAMLTAATCGLGAALLALMHAAALPMSAVTALGVLTLAYAIPSGVLLWQLLLPIPEFWRFGGWAAYRQYLRQSRWVMVGVLSTEALARAYAIMVPGWFGVGALGTLSAAQVLLRPVVLAANAWGWVARSDMAARREAHDWRALERNVAQGIAFSLAVSLPWMILVASLWPQISTHLYAGKYAEAGHIALLWGIWAALAGIQGAVNSGLQALRAFRALALANLCAAGVTVMAILLLFQRFDFPSAIVGMWCGQVVEIALMLAILLRHLPHRSTSRAAISAPSSDRPR